MNKSLKILALSLGLGISGVGIYCVNAEENNFSSLEQHLDGGKKNKKSKAEQHAVSTEVQVQNTWEVPSVLTEISGIAYVKPNVFACVQDEEGVIFLYNTSTKTIEKTIPFAGAGDYEGITIAGSTAYIVRSDGHLYEVKQYASDKPQVQEFSTYLTAQNNVEGLGYDAKHNRLLLAIKGAEEGDKPYKGVYAFDLKTKKMAAQPVYKIDLEDPIFTQEASKKSKKAMQPSEIAVNPKTGDIYVTEAVNPKVLILDPQGNTKSLYWLDKETFAQPEGIAFSPAGELFISNEGKSESANIMKVDVSAK